MRKIFIAGLGLLSMAIVNSVNAFQDRYVAYEKFALINDKHERARHWAICAAIYEASAVVHETLFNQPADAKQMRELSNGAKVAVSMTFVAEMAAEMGDLEASGLVDRFKATWDFAKLMSNTMPETIKTVIDADLSKVTDENSLMDALKPIFETATICMSNVELQQAMINLWRELAMSGLLTVPNE